MAMARYVIDRNIISYLVILGYAPKINKVETSPLKLKELLIALKNI